MANYDREDQLDGWKEISGYLCRDTRTCQRWEKEFGLPIHRINTMSDRAKVHAYRSELDEWQKTRSNLKSFNNNRHSFPSRRVFFPGLIILLLAAASVFLVIQRANSRSSDNPVKSEIVGNSLSFFGSQNEFLWKKEIDSTIRQEEYYRDNEGDFWGNRQDNRYKRSRVAFFDIDKDGKNEVICVLNHESGEKRCITLLNNNGKRIWEKSVPKPQRYQIDDLPLTYKLEKLSFEDLYNDGEPEILALWHHTNRFPSIFVIYDINGNELFRYDHPGHLCFYRIHTLQDDKPYIFIGGTNNLLDGDAVLSVIDPGNLKSGCAPPYKLEADLQDRTELEKYIPIRPQKAAQASYVRFRRNALMRTLSNWIYLVYSQADSHSISLMIHYADLIDTTLNYTFDNRFRLTDIQAGGEFRRGYQRILEKGTINLPLPEYLNQLDKEILFWTGDGWAASPTAIRIK